MLSPHLIPSGKARVAGVAGWPIAHSRSPRIHGFWLQRYGIDGAYVPLAIRPDQFDLAIRGLSVAGFSGINVTVPHKRAAFEACHVLTPAARRAGAANTLVFEAGRISGDNTDGWGFLASLREQGVDPGAGPALLLGAGGSARAIAASLQDCGVTVTLANRTRERAEAMARDLPGLRIIDWDRRSAALGDQALLVNTTTLGMAGQPALSIDLDRAAPGLAVADIVYVPLETPLLAQARARGLTTVDGLGLLLHQARPGFAAWFGVQPEVDTALRDFVLADLRPA